MARKYRAREVFVPGGLPTHTYVQRSANLEKQLEKASDNLCKLVVITGPTKSGKTVLTRQVFPREKAVWIDGGTIAEENDIWNTILDQLDEFTNIIVSDESSTEAKMAGGFEAEANLLIAKGKGTLQPSYAKTRRKGQTQGRTVSPKIKAIETLRASRTPLIIDDFHYLPKPIQGSVVRGLKSLIIDGHPVIFLAIPHRRYDAVAVEKEMTGRVENIRIPDWSRAELKQIPDKGFKLLKASASSKITNSFLDECLNSPHLMQEFCRHLCDLNAVEETCDNERVLSPSGSTEKLYRDVAKGTSKTVFDALAKGPRQRSDRIPRKFKDGRTGDIYVAVLHAIASTKPGTTTLEYEEIRASLRDLLDGSLPQAHEVTRVIDKMVKISKEDKTSEPVLDWEKEDRRLHVIDPFFAFFLRWGVE